VDEKQSAAPDTLRTPARPSQDRCFGGPRHRTPDIRFWLDSLGRPPVSAERYASQPA
jgi:hypothetical protein